MKNPRLMSISSALVVLALGLTSCGSSTDSRGDSDSDTPSSLQDGTLDVFSSGDYPPFSYLDTDGKTMLGMEKDMLDAIGPKLGVDVKYQIVPFDTTIPGIANGRGDMLIMSMSDTEERRKQVDFIDLYNTSFRVLTRQGNPSGINLGDDQDKADPLGLCGKTGAAVTGSQMEASLTVVSQECVEAGREPVETLIFPIGTQEYLSVKTGRADFDLMQPAQARYFLEQNADMEALPGSFKMPGVNFTGWVFSKDNKDLQDKVHAAINELVEEGTWAEILGNYGLSENDAVIPPLRNGAPFETG